MHNESNLAPIVVEARVAAGVARTWQEQAWRGVFAALVEKLGVAKGGGHHSVAETATGH